MVRVDWVRSQIEALAAVRGRPDQMKTRKRGTPDTIQEVWLMSAVTTNTIRALS